MTQADPVRLAIVERGLQDHLDECNKATARNDTAHTAMFDALRSLSNRVWILVVGALGAAGTFIAANLPQLLGG